MLDVPEASEPTRPTTRHHPGLDGLRGAAVAAVLLFHGGFSWAKGGYLGVSTFFTLSGFLITGLLLEEWRRHSRIVLRRFWERRFRRLLPALLLAMVGIAAFAAFVADPDQLDRIRTDALSTLAYVANWRFVSSGQAYTELFDAPSPLLHAWSLAIEEQFYLLFPLLVAVVLRLARGCRSMLAWVLAGLAAGSIVSAVVLGDDITRTYYGTDTRAAELLLGALLAVWFTGAGRDLPDRPRRLLAGAGAAGLGASILAWVLVAQTSGWLYRGGFALYAFGTTAVVAAAVAPGPVRTILSWGPLQLLGRVSYGVYLFHWPVFLWLDEEATGLDGILLFALRLGVTFGVAAVSYLVVEEPIRRGALPGWRAAALLPPVVASVVVAVLLATVPPDAPGRLVAAAPRPTASTAPVADLLVRDATPADPLRVLLVGDSIAYDAAAGIEAALEATGEAEVHNHNVPGFGLWETYDWRLEWPVLLADLDPDVVVAQWGGWDIPRFRALGRTVYEKRYHQSLEVLASSGAKLLVLGEPIATDRAGKVRPRDVVPIQRRLALEHGAWWLDADDWLSDGGAFASHLPGPGGVPERVRKHDNAHICPAGAARFGEALLAFLTPRYGFGPVDPRWRGGDWVLAPQFDDPPGACAG